MACAARLCVFFGAVMLTVQPACAQHQNGDQEQPPATGVHVHEIGAMVMSSVVPPLLAPRSGGRLTPGFGLFLTVRPTEDHM